MSIFNKTKRCDYGCYGAILFLTIAVCLAGTALAKDTDVYKVSTKQNCYVLMDSSGSMAFPVYDETKDYGAIYDYLYDLARVDDVVVAGAYYGNHHDRNKIYLIQGDAGLAVRTIDTQQRSFAGDPMSSFYWASPLVFLTWDFLSITDTRTYIDASGDLTAEGGFTARVGSDGSDHVTFDGDTLPLGQDIAMNNPVPLYDGTSIDNGFAGMMRAPGCYFSGYEGVTAGSLNTAEDGDQDIFFFATGNWINMLKIANLVYTSSPNNGDPAWVYEEIPLSGPGEWTVLDKNERFPVGGGTYAHNLDEVDTQITIVQPGATGIQVHFSAFDVNPDGAQGDDVQLREADGHLAARYDNSNIPGDGWSATVDGDTVLVQFRSNSTGTGTGYIIDQIRYTEGPYMIKSRLDVAQGAMVKVVDEFRGKMNWGFASYANGDGAQINAALNPNDNDDTNRAAIVTAINGVSPSGGTPIGEALQDVFQWGYWNRRSSLDNLECRKNYVISVSDGYPSGDYDWSRIGGVTITDSDGDQWTQDPISSTDPDYLDDVANWMYNHSYISDTKAAVADPPNSTENVMTHQVAFGGHNLLMEDAAADGGGLYSAAFNEAQLVAAFYALALQMTDAVSFTAPVVSVDAANKIQNGDDLYLGLFLPRDALGWVGNLKKYKLGNGTTRPDPWLLYDGGDNLAIDSQGRFLDNGTAFWADDNDANDSDDYGGHDVLEDGVGEVLTERVAANFGANNYYERPIYTYVNNVMVKMETANADITAALLNVADNETRNKVINYVHGYTYDTDGTLAGSPAGVRDWALGSIVHSSPVVVDYYDPGDITLVQKRYLVVGANDGMLHVFDDSPGAGGEEVFAFVPPDVLTKLQNLPNGGMQDMVDGEIVLYRSNKQPNYIIFGLRGGGETYWCLNVTDQNPLNWTVQWSYSPAEMGQTWAKPQLAAIPVGLNTGTGEISFKDIVIFSGGYDIEEENFPEPFDDLDFNGTPFRDNGNIDTAEWHQGDADYDYHDDDDYNLYNPEMNEEGRGIFAVDIHDPAAVTSFGGSQVLPFSVTYGATDVTSGGAQTLSSMRFCFPATPSVVSTDYTYYYESGGSMVEDRKKNVLDAVYAVDIYANLYKLVYKFDVQESGGSYSVTDSGWTASLIFSGNPGSASGGGTFNGGTDPNDQGRKTFYSPAVSWGGSCDYFDKGNYGFSGVTFDGQYDIATLFFGTGDREHPTYSLIKDRLYAVYDDTSVTADDGGGAVTVSTAPYTEDSLLNLSCDELDDDTNLSGRTKEELREDLLDDVEYSIGSVDYFEDGYENDAKGWYIILEDQGDPTDCSHCTYAGAILDSTTASRDNHDNEKILSKVALFYGILYFTSYQPGDITDCNPQGHGYAYSLNYCDATAAYNSNTDNDAGDEERRDVTDRFHKITGIFGIPSDFVIINRDGGAGAYAMMGGRVIGPGPGGSGGGGGYEIDSPGWGLELYYWREGNSQEP